MGELLEKGGGVAERTPLQGRLDRCLPQGTEREVAPCKVSKDKQDACQMYSHPEGGRGSGSEGPFRPCGSMFMKLDQNILWQEPQRKQMGNKSRTAFQADAESHRAGA